MTVVVLGRVADMAPLPAQVRNQIWIRRIARYGVARPNRLYGVFPQGRRQGLGMIVDGPEIEGRAEAGEIAGIGRGRGALSARKGKTHHERVEAEGRVDMEVSEQDLLLFRRTQHTRGVGLHVDSLFHGGCGARRLHGFRPALHHFRASRWLRQKTRSRPHPI